MNSTTSDTAPQIVAVGFMAVAVAAALTLGGLQSTQRAASTPHDVTYLQAIETGEDHIAAADLARELLAAPTDLVVVDVRPAEEFAAWHLPTAINLTVPQVCGDEGKAIFAKNPRLVVLCSNGPAHPAQAWVELQKQGHTNVKVLDGGLDAFKNEILTPASLRDGGGTASTAGAALRRAFFLGKDTPNPLAAWATDPAQLTNPTMVSPKWLHERLGKVAVLDVRSSEEFAALHVPGAQPLSLGKIRVKAGDRDLHFVANDQLADHFGKLGIAATTPVVIVSDEKLQDATMAAVALLRLGHRPLAILEGGMLRWATERRPLVATTSAPTPMKYEPQRGADAFAIGIDELAATVKDGKTAVLDVRPPEFFRGEKSTEARPGHIPGAKNRVFTKDLVKTDDGQWLRPRADLEKEYAATGIGKTDDVVVHCRTGHTASEAYFVMRYLLGYEKVRWFNGSWTEWAERKDLPAATGDQ